jgi:diguanylate cyclase (GGDEF)-like protein
MPGHYVGQSTRLYLESMSKTPDVKNAEELERLADESGLAIAVAGEGSRQITAFNDNSICRHLNPDGKFSPACSRFCGVALDKTREAGKPVGFICHAGLDCRAVLYKNGHGDKVVIVGRTFLKADNYRKATERAVAGDWRQYSPSEFFENVLLSGSVEQLDKTTRRVRESLERTPEKRSLELTSVPSVQPPPPIAEPDKAATRSTLVSKFNREVRADAPATVETTPRKPEPKTPEKTPQANTKESRTAEARAWRSFFGSILKTDHAKASASILEFLAHQYGFSSLVWLEGRDGRFEGTAVYGEMEGRKVRLGIKANDRRLVEALNSELPLSLGERSARDGSSAARLMNVFPVGVDGDITAAVAILDPLDDDEKKHQIARICHSVAPQLEILRLRGEVSGRDALANAVKTFTDSLRSIDGDDFWQTVTQNAAQILRAERASLLIQDEKSGDLEVKAMIGANNMVPQGTKVGNRVSRVVFERNEAALVVDVTTTNLKPAPRDRRYHASSFLSYPISVGHRTIGVMNFTERAGGEAFDKHSLELFQAIAPQLAVAVDRASLKEKAGAFEQLSVTDALTGLLNRRYMEERLLEEIKRSNRHGFPMSFMMLDVDHFKSFNDQFGHPAGDEALRTVAHVIRETLRGADVAARFGGEEFAILLPQTTGPEGVAIAERIRLNLENTDFQHRQVTASIGVASCSADLCASDTLVAAADKALYAAKRQGRNCVLAYDEMNARAV